MWHQVLTHPDAPRDLLHLDVHLSFARGVRYGWLEEPEPYVAAVFKAWEALTKDLHRQGRQYPRGLPRLRVLVHAGILQAGAPLESE